MSFREMVHLKVQVFTKEYDFCDKVLPSLFSRFTELSLTIILG